MEKQNENTKTTDNGQFIRLFNNVRRNKNLRPLDKMILSHIISYQLQDKEFFMSNDGIAYEYGTSTSTAQRAINRLEKYLIKRKVHTLNAEGVPMPKRYLKVINLDAWTNEKPKASQITDYTQFKTPNDFLDWLSQTIGRSNIEQFLRNNEVALNHLEAISNPAIRT